MQKVSAVIITFNEAENLRRSLPQLYWCDEIIIVDSYSTDETLTICKNFGCKIYQRKFNGYGDQKKLAISLAKNDWVLCIDADECLSQNLVEEIQQNLNDHVKYDGFYIPMNLVFCGKEFLYGKECHRHFLRLFNKTKGEMTLAKVHEGIQLQGPTKKLKNIALHYSYKNIHQYLNKLNKYTGYGAAIALEKRKRKPKAILTLALPFNFFKYYLLERNFLNGYKGFNWSLFNTLYHFLKYAKLDELYEEKNSYTERQFEKNDVQTIERRMVIPELEAEVFI